MTSGPHQTSGPLPQMQETTQCFDAAAAAGRAVNPAGAQLYCPVMRVLFYLKTASFGGGGG